MDEHQGSEGDNKQGCLPLSGRFAGGAGMDERYQTSNLPANSISNKRVPATGARLRQDHPAMREQGPEFPAPPVSARLGNQPRQSPHRPVHSASTDRPPPGASSSLVFATGGRLDLLCASTARSLQKAVSVLTSTLLTLISLLLLALASLR